jgi:hypothetical protein
MLRMNCWRATVLQRVAEYAKQYLRLGGVLTTLMNYLERSRRVSSINLEEFLLAHQVKRLLPHPKSLNFQDNFLGICVAQMNNPRNAALIAYSGKLELS